MKKQLTCLLAGFGMLLGAAGCINYQGTPLPQRDLIKVAPLNMDNIPPTWMAKFNKDVDRVPLTVSLEMDLPFGMDLPKNSAFYGSADNSVSFVNANEVYSQFFTQRNLDGADLKFWRDLLYRMMSETNGYKNIQEGGFITREAFDGFELTGTKQMGKLEYKYRVVCVLVDNDVYFAELYGRTAQFDQAVKEFDFVVRNWDLSIWRINRDRSETYTFFSYGPVVVNVPDAKSGIFKPGWSILQLGVCPYAQIFKSPVNIYGLNLNIWSSQQACTYGLSYSILNASKDHRGIQIGAFASAAEDNYGLALSTLYSAARCNNGLLLSLFTRSEKGSSGVQLGLVNFSSSPRYFPWFPLISLPIFDDVAK